MRAVVNGPGAGAGAGAILAHLRFLLPETSLLPLFLQFFGTFRVQFLHLLALFERQVRQVPNKVNELP
jgi:hypothetical protein